MGALGRLWRFLARASCVVGWPRRRLDARLELAGVIPAPAEDEPALDALLAGGAAAPFAALAARGITLAARIDRPEGGRLAFCAVLCARPRLRFPEPD